MNTKLEANGASIDRIASALSDEDCAQLRCKLLELSLEDREVTVNLVSRSRGTAAALLVVDGVITSWLVGPVPEHLSDVEAARIATGLAAALAISYQSIRKQKSTPAH